jgi:ribosomal protein S18 acetylase RimI-like enzyme
MEIKDYKKIDKENIITVNSMLSKYISNFKLKDNYNKFYTKFVLQKNNISIIACLKKKAVGYASINFNTSIRGGIRAYIEDVVVEKKYRKKGIGKSLLNILLKYAKKKNCYKIVLESKKKNINFYKSCGYKLNSFTMRKLIK